MLHPRNLLAALVLATMATSLGAEPVAQSAGRWAGPISERSPGWLAEGRIELRVDGTPEKFSVDLVGPAGKMLGGEFRAGERKNVFGPPAATGLMSYLGRGSAVNPIEGKPLAWARRDGETLVVYRLELRNGLYRLDRAVLAPTATGLRVAFERREHDKPAQTFTAMLQRTAR
jgi:hypothetical protein